MGKKLLTVLLSLCLTVGVLPMAPVKAEGAKTVATQSGLLDQAPASKMAVAKAYFDYQEAFQVPVVYEETPSLVAPYTPGKLSLADKQGGLATINSLRTIANLGKVTLDEELSRKAQLGSMKFAFDGKIPADLTSDYFREAHYTWLTWGGSIFGGTADASNRPTAQSVSGYFFDLGEKRPSANQQVLQPRLNSVGFGRTNYVESHGALVSAMAVECGYNYRSETSDWDFVAWPSAGYFPSEWLNYGIYNTSMFVNDLKYDVLDEGLKVEITTPWNKTYTVDTTEKPIGNALPGAYDGASIKLSAGNNAYFAFQYHDMATVDMWSGDWLTGSYVGQPGTYHFKWTGLKDINTGAPVTIEYDTIAFEAEAYRGQNLITEEQYDMIGEFVERLYQVCLGRGSDAAGRADWSDKLAEGKLTGVQTARGFVFSPEFKNKNLCNEDYVKNLYRGFMGREADAAGLADWVSRLESGTTREAVFNGFALSKEFAGLCNTYGIKQGGAIEVPKYGTVPTGNCSECGKEDGISSFVKRLYQVCLDREADQGGLADWSKQLRNHSITGYKAARGFIFSKEFLGHEYNNSDYVEHLYMAFLGRPSDQAGKADWVSKLEAGATRESVFDGFAGSREFKNICNQYGIIAK